jgi:hypothetical protein
MKIYIDVDDTLNYFQQHLKDNGAVPPRGAGQYWLRLPSTWTKKQREADAKVVELMQSEEFWMSVPIRFHAQWFINRMKTIGEVKLLTAFPPRCSNVQDIIDWKLKYCNQSFDIAANDIIICDRKDKAMFANPHSVLIDDTKLNCDEWRKAGGVAYQYDENALNYYSIADLVKEDSYA